MKIICKSLVIVLIILSVFFYSIKIEQSYAADTYPFNAIITSADGLVVHSEANYKSSTFVTELAYGTRFVVTGKTGSMYAIKYESGKTGYVSAGSTLVLNLDQNTLTSDAYGIETYRSYCDSLINQGFTESYCPYLYFLHSKYPNWIFKADKVGVSIEEASKSEEWKCSLQTDNINFLVGKDKDNSRNEANYYYVNSKVIASYMDPRNSLSEANIFQFFDSDDNKELYSENTISSIVGSGNLAQYVTVFRDAASENGINAVQLVSRSFQEGANNSGYSMVSGTYTTTSGNTYNGNSLDGYYNFYNISTYGSGAYVKGLAYAAGYFDSSITSYGRPWNSPEKAIKGGAEFLASTYIKIGQDTPYYQKFNVSSYRSSGNGIYSHQYMTNIAAPAQEGKSMFATYKANNDLNQAFHFTIPVYNNMSSNPYQAVDLSTDSTLSSIMIEGENISGFDKDVTEYFIYYPTNKTSVNVSAIANNGGASISGVGTVNFYEDKAIVNISVTSEDKTKTTNYVVNITRIAEGTRISVNDIVSKIDVKINGNLMYGISPGLDAGTLIGSVTKNGGNAVIKDVNGNNKSSGILATGDIITISGTNETLTYTIGIKGDLSGDGIVKINDLILVQSHILGKKTLEGIYVYAADCNGDGSVKINDLILIQSQILGKVNL